MREILFRGKQLDNGEWVEGYYRLHGWRMGTIEEEICPTITPFGNTPITYGVEPATVGQYTGLTDKNGKKIFEGDIFRANNGRNVCIAVVKFGEFYPKMFYKMLDMYCAGTQHIPAKGFYAESVDKHEEMFLFQSPCVEVIGNIHDNPELLEVEK